MDLLTPGEVAAELKLAAQTLANMRHQGGGPPFVKLGDAPNAPIRYPRRDLDRWLAGRKFTRTHDRATA